MFHPEQPIDPIVEILRLAYRRGLAIQREQEEKNKGLKPIPLEENDPHTAEPEPKQTVTQKDISSE